MRDLTDNVNMQYTNGSLHNSQLCFKYAVILLLGMCEAIHPTLSSIDDT